MLRHRELRLIRRTCAPPGSSPAPFPVLLHGQALIYGSLRRGRSACRSVSTIRRRQKHRPHFCGRSWF